MKKLISLGLAMTLLTSLLTGCGTRTNATGDASKQETTHQASAQYISLKVFHHMSEQVKKDGLDGITTGFTKTNPNIKFDIQYIGNDQYNNILKIKIAGGDAPDLMQGRAVQYVDAVKAGQILDLTGQAFLKNIYDSALTSDTLDSKIYGVPFDVGVEGVYYNKDLFKTAGVEVPKTWPDFVKVLDALKAKNISAISAGFKDGWTLDIIYESMTFGGLTFKDNNWCSELSDRTKKFTAIPEFKTVVQDLTKILDYVTPDPFSSDYEKSIADFAAGRAAMLFQGNWAAGEIRKNNPQGNFGFFMMPMFDKADDNRLSSFVDDGFMASAQTKSKDVLLKFFEYCADKEAAQTWSAKTLNVSTVKGLKIDNNDPMLVDILAYVNGGKTINHEAFLPLQGEYNDAFNKTMEEYGAINPQERNVDKLIAQLDAQFDKIKSATK